MVSIIPLSTKKVFECNGFLIEPLVLQIALKALTHPADSRLLVNVGTLPLIGFFYFFYLTDSACHISDGGVLLLTDLWLTGLCFTVTIIKKQKQHVYMHVSLFEWRLQTTAVCWCRVLFPLTQAQNIHACWLSAVVSAVCACTTFWPRYRRREAMQQSASVAASILKSVWCAWAFKESFLLKRVL